MSEGKIEEARNLKRRAKKIVLNSKVFEFSVTVFRFLAFSLINGISAGSYNFCRVSKKTNLIGQTVTTYNVRAYPNNQVVMRPSEKFHR